MFVSFFPRPKLFFLTAIGWTVFVMVIWYAFGDQISTAIGLAVEDPNAPPIIGVEVFWSPPFLFFYLYFFVAVALFSGAWMYLLPHPWAWWSIPGSALIIFVIYFQVQVSVAINAWYNPFYNLIQTALTQPGEVTLAEFFAELITFAEIAFLAVAVGVLISFFMSHWVFRWRTAMNNYYMENWQRLRTVEGASQRVQEDTMRFAGILQGMGASLIDSVMTLIAFLPVLVVLSANVTELPLIGAIPNALVWVAIVWSLFGTGIVALVGIRLPGLEFRNQRVEAAYRKELVLGEDNPARADPPTAMQLFRNVRRNYFRLYLNFAYFNIGRIVYLQTDNIMPYIILGPTIVAGAITLGILNQILNAFGQVRGSFQYLVNSWGTVVELISIYKRLRTFEASMRDQPLAPIEKTIAQDMAVPEK